MLEIDGAEGEGGGQILRTALSLSCITQTPVRISNIRANRPNPGLARQHLAVCAALAKITDAKTSHMELASTEFEFEPGKISGGNYEFDIGSAGSTVLLAQAILPVLLFADGASTATLRGGTHVMASPTFDYFRHVFLPAIEKFGAHAAAKLLSPGFYPKGGGKIEIAAEPSKLSPATFANEKNPKVNAAIITCGLPKEVASRACAALLSKFPDAQIKSTVASGHSTGFAITIWSGFIGASCLGRRGAPSEQIVAEAAANFDSGRASLAAVDSHLADQLLPYMALAPPGSELKTSELTNHAKTNISIIEKFTPGRFKVSHDGANAVIAI